MTNLFIFSIMLCFVMGGCAANYKYWDSTYNSRELARNAAVRDISQNVAGVVPSLHRIGGTILVAVPTRDVIEKHGVKRGTLASQDVIGYIVDVLELDWVGMASA